MIDLILSTGTNLGDRQNFILEAKLELAKHWDLIEESRTYESSAVDYLDQPDFLNQVLHFRIDQSLSPLTVLKKINEIEKNFGRRRIIDKGPRTLDIDILFYGTQVIEDKHLSIPHPRQFQRSFIIIPLRELKVFESLNSTFSFPLEFDNSCWVFKS